MEHGIQSTSGANSLDDKKLIARCMRLVRDWDSVESRIKNERLDRKLNLSTEEARSKEIIHSSETFVPMPVIRESCARERPKFVQFLDKSPRQIVVKFKELQGGQPLSEDKFELEFTQLFRYSGWQLPFYKWIDSGVNHGTGVIEVLADDPANVDGLGLLFEDFPIEDFIYPMQMSKLENASTVIRRYRCSDVALAKLAAAHKFDQKIIKELTDNNTSKDDAYDANAVYVLFKMFIKGEDGSISFTFVSEKRQDKLLCPLTPHNAGEYNVTLPAPNPITGLPDPAAIPVGAPKPCMEFPFFLYAYDLTSDDIVAGMRGRANMDLAFQRAQTGIATSYVNGLRRACLTFPSYKQQSTTMDSATINYQGAPRHMEISDKPLEFANLPPPPVQTLGSMDYFDGKKKQETGDVGLSVLGRNDRKTAYELQSAEDQGSELDSVPIFSFSMAMTRLCNYVVRIVRNNMQLPGNTFMVNDPQRLDYATRPITVLPAGDVDVVERGKKLNKFIQLFPMAQTNPAMARVFMTKIIELAFPQEANEILLAAQDNTALVLQECITVIQGMIEMLSGQPGTEQTIMNLQHIIQQAQQTLAQYGSQRTGQRPAENGQPGESVPNTGKIGAGSSGDKPGVQNSPSGAPINLR